MKHPEVKIEQRQIHDAVAIDLAWKETIEAKSARRALSVEGPPQTADDGRRPTITSPSPMQPGELG
jgi:hypothetical protein